MIGVAIGAGLLALGTASKFLAGRQKERAFNRALRTRQAAVNGFNTERSDALQQYGEGLIPLSGQAAQNKVNALSGLSEAGRVGDQAAQQGIGDINQATNDVFAQAPVSNVFGTQNGAGQFVQSQKQQQMQPMLQSQATLSALGLGQLAQQRQSGDVMRQNSFDNIDNANQFQQLQQNNALRTGDIGLRDLQSQLAFQAAAQKAQGKGGMLDAFGGLAQQVGGGMIGAGSSAKAT